MNLKAIQDRLAREIGLDPASLGEAVIRRAVDRRRAELGLGPDDDYPARLDASADERQALIEELVVPESWFFRDVQPFALLRDHAATWAAEPARPPFRALSLPCSTGEEPYSIALTLLDAGLPRERFRVVAIDLSARALARARAGTYRARSLRDLPAGLRRRHFLAHGDGLEVAPAVREAVEFRQGNLLDPALLAGQPPFDAIFCRNLLIYLDVPARERAAATLDRLLAPDGLLFVGHAERLSLLSARFAVVGPPGAFAYRRGRGAAPVPTPRPTPETSPKRTVPSHRPRPAATPAAPRPATPAEPSPPDLLDQAADLANRRSYAEAAGLCEQHMRRHGPSARAYHLLGVIQQAMGMFDQAERSLGRAVYLDGRQEDALLALALLADRRGDPAAAAGYRRRAERAGKNQGR